MRERLQQKLNAETGLGLDRHRWKLGGEFVKVQRNMSLTGVMYACTIHSRAEHSGNLVWVTWKELTTVIKAIEEPTAEDVQHMVRFADSHSTLSSHVVLTTLSLRVTRRSGC